MTKIFLIRHGEAEKTEQDTVLTKKGHEEAEALAQKLCEIDFDKIFVSNLTRAKETANYFIKSQNIPVIETSELREIYRVIVGGPERKGTPEDRESNDRQRADKFWSEVLQERGNIAVFTHGNLIRYLLMKTLEIEKANLWENLFLSTGSMSVIEKTQDHLRIDAVNLIDHLPSKKEFYKKESITTKYHP